MKKLNLKLLILFMFVSLIVCIPVLAQSTSVLNFFKRDGDAINFTNSDWEFGSTTNRIAKIWADDGDFTAITIGAVASGDIDMQGNDIVNLDELKGVTDTELDITSLGTGALRLISGNGTIEMLDSVNIDLDSPSTNTLTIGHGDGSNPATDGVGISVNSYFGDASQKSSASFKFISSVGMGVGKFNLVAKSDYEGHASDNANSYVGLWGVSGINRNGGGAVVGALVDASQVGGGEQLDYTVLAVNDRVRIQPISVSGEGQSVYLSGSAFGGGGSVNGFVAIDDATSPTTPTQTLDEESLYIKSKFEVDGNSYFDEISYFNKNAIGETQSNALSLVNNTDATVGTDQYSPTLKLVGNAWGTTSGSSEETSIEMYNQTGKSTIGYPSYMVDSVDGAGTRTNLLGMSKFGTSFNIVAYFNANLVMSNNRTIFFGSNADDSGMEWDTNQTNDTLAMWLGSSSKSLMIGDFANKDNNYGLASSSYPAIYLLGNTTSSTKYGKIGFDDTDFIIETGAGGNVFNQAGTVLADDGYYDLTDATSGWGVVIIGDNQEYARFRWASDGTVDLDEVTANVLSTDTDGNLCIFGSGTTVRIKNRLGSELTIKYQINY